MKYDLKMTKGYISFFLKQKKLPSDKTVDLNTKLLPMTSTTEKVTYSQVLYML